MSVDDKDVKVKMAYLFSKKPKDQGLLIREMGNIMPLSR